MRLLSRLVAASPKLVLAAAVCCTVLFGLFGLNLQNRVSIGGFDDPGSESAQVDKVVRDQLGPQNPDVIAVYTVPPGQTLADLGPRVTQAVDRIAPDRLARKVETYWNNSPPRQGLLRSTDGRQALAVVFLAGDETQRIAAYPDIAAALRIPGVDTRFAGYSALANEISDQSRHDLIRAESLSLPVTLAILVLVFGGVVAAALPVMVGILTVVGALGAIGLIARYAEVSVFAVNVVSLLGLGLAIDYGLFLVSRYREELDAGRSVPQAVSRSMATAGRTITFSALLLACAFAGTFVFPQAALRSLGFGAIAAVILAALLSLIVLPAALLVLGPRITRWTWRADAFERGERRAARFWGRVVSAVLRRPGAVVVAVTALLLVMAAPLASVRLGEIDHTALPAGNPTRATVEELTAQFPAANSGATVLIRGDTTTAAAIVQRVGGVPGVRQVLRLSSDHDTVILHATLDAPDRSPAANETVTRIRQLDVPAGTEVQVGGESATVVDGVDAITDRLPLMIAIMIAATMVLLLCAFRSVMLPIKAVLMAALSLTATFGVLSWIFYQGHLAGLLGVSTGPLSGGMVVLIIAVVFGLSTDYEVFLLSRMSEAHRAGADTAGAVRTGIVRTARVITAAAALLILITGAFTLSPLTPMRTLGIGMIVALFIDATLVRMLLVPALVQLMGPINWWPSGRRRDREPTATDHATAELVSSADIR
ncbi:MMPL family transporter [Nocardia sp. NPDC006044]|uniref:MMPL family transporter n=1 Tax=Nocardia sp. NPDC006044 TaxID=3364306 RepID=UPI0036A96B60